MRFAVKDHYGQSLPLIRALQAAGHELVSDGPLDLFLIDLDPDVIYGYRQLIDWAADQGAVVLQYPHGAPASTLCYDSLYEPHGRVDGQLTFGEGEAGLLERLGVQRPSRVIGWTLCPQLPMRLPDGAPRKVLFGPTHPNVEGNMQPARLKENRDVFRALLDGPWTLTVRYCGELAQNGLWEAEGVRYVQGLLDNSTVEIDAADTVVAGEGTFPTLAVARGCPTVIYGQLGGAEYGLPGETPTPLARRDLYEDWVRYPADAGDVPLARLLRSVAGGDFELIARVRDWARRWIGRPFHGPSFARTIEDWVPELRETRDLGGIGSLDPLVRDG